MKARKLILERLAIPLRVDVLVHSIVYAPEALRGEHEGWHGSQTEIWKQLWKLVDEGVITVDDRGVARRVEEVK